MNSTFKYWEANGNTAPGQFLTANGVDTVNFVGATGIYISMDSLATPQQVTIGLTGAGGPSYWSQTGNQLYPSTIANNVGIGTTGSASYALDVNGNTNIVGNFYISQTTLPTLVTTQIGYQNTVTNTYPTISSTNPIPPYPALVSVTINSGVWLVEGSFEGQLTSVPVYVISLSTTTSFSLDITRTNVILSNNINAGFASTISSSVFVFAVPTTIYLYFYFQSGSASSCSSTIRYTKIG
jgi:hypothetical protein